MSQCSWLTLDSSSIYSNLKSIFLEPSLTKNYCKEINFKLTDSMFNSFLSCVQLAVDLALKLSLFDFLFFFLCTSLKLLAMNRASAREFFFRNNADFRLWTRCLEGFIRNSMIYFLYFLVGALFCASHDKIMDFDFTFWVNSADMSLTRPGCGQATRPIISVI